jgi:GTP cyclohydrolase II
MDANIVLPTAFGNLHVSCISFDNEEAILIQSSKLSETPFVRIHSSCVFSESFHANDCDCALQLNASLEYISTSPGLIIYLYQEGRGIGIKSKILAIALQQKENLNTADAFRRLGFDIDPRRYDIATHILKELNIKKVKIATSNPKKIAAIELAGISVVERLTLPIKKSSTIQCYIDSKTAALGHYEEN